MKNLRTMLVSKEMESIKCPYAMKPEYVVIHNTANDASAENEVKYMISNYNYTSFHYAVDEKEVVQGIREDRNAFHSSDGAEGEGNRKGIAIEICYSKSGGERFVEAEKNAAELAAELLQKYNLGIDRLKRHYDFAPDKKYCPHRTMDMGWDRFVDMVRVNMGEKPTEKKRVLDPNKVFEIGDLVTIPGVFIVDEVSASRNAICNYTLSNGKPYESNWIDAVPCDEVNRSAVKQGDQIFRVNEHFIINGDFKVLDIDVQDDAILIKIGSRNTWVKAKPVSAVYYK